MKKLIVGLFVTASACLGVYAQGQVNFTTFGSGVNALATNGLTGVVATGNGYYCNLFYGTAAMTSDQFVSVANPPATLNVAGYVSAASGGGTRSTDPAVLAAGAAGLFQVRAWSAVLGTDYTAARATWLGGSIPTAVMGSSNILPGAAPASPAPPLTLTGLQSYTLAPIPEPSVIALGALGLAALLYRRRK